MDVVGRVIKVPPSVVVHLGCRFRLDMGIRDISDLPPLIHACQHVGRVPTGYLHAGTDLRQHSEEHWNEHTGSRQR